MAGANIPPTEPMVAMPFLVRPHIRLDNSSSYEITARSIVRSSSFRNRSKKSIYKKIKCRNRDRFYMVHEASANP